VLAPSFVAFAVLTFALSADGSSGAGRDATQAVDLGRHVVESNRSYARPRQSAPPAGEPSPPPPAPMVVSVADVFDGQTAYYWVAGSDTDVRRRVERISFAPFPGWTFQSNSACGPHLVVAYGTASSDGTIESNFDLARRRAVRLANLIESALALCENR